MHGADAARRLQANPILFEVQRVSETLGLHSRELDEVLVREWLFEPVEELGCGVHLVVVLAESSVPECTSGSVWRTITRDNVVTIFGDSKLDAGEQSLDARAVLAEGSRSSSAMLEIPVMLFEGSVGLLGQPA